MLFTIYYLHFIFLLYYIVMNNLENPCLKCPSRNYIKGRRTHEMNPVISGSARKIALYILDEAQCSGPTEPAPNDNSDLKRSACSNGSLSTAMTLLHNIDAATAE